MAHQEITPFVQRGQCDDQGGEHAGRFLGVAVADEETALVIDQQFVQFRRHRFRHTEPGRGADHDGIQALRPVLPLNADPIGVDLPGPPDIGVDQGLRAAAVRRTRRDRDELLGLGRQQRQGNRADIPHLQQGQVHGARTGRIEVAGGAGRAQQSGKFVREGSQGVPFCVNYASGVGDLPTDACRTSLPPSLITPRNTAAMGISISTLRNLMVSSSLMSCNTNKPSARRT